MGEHYYRYEKSNPRTKIRKTRSQNRNTRKKLAST